MKDVGQGRRTRKTQQNMHAETGATMATISAPTASSTEVSHEGGCCVRRPIDGGATYTPRTGNLTARTCLR